MNPLLQLRESLQTAWLVNRISSLCVEAAFAKELFDDEVNRQVGLMVTRGPGQINKAQARVALKKWLAREGYKADKPGTIEDLGSDQRLNLILETETRLYHGEMQWRGGMHRAVMYTHPAWEFYRGEPRKEPRDWPRVWEENGGVFYPGHASYPEGRMIARKDSSIWTAISRFNLPYCPMDFNSGMKQRGVERDWCIEHKLVLPQTPQEAFK